MSAIKVRPAVPEDYRQWLLLWNSYLQFYKTEVEMTTTELTWKRVTAPDGDLRCVVSEDASGRITGFAIYLFHQSSWAATWNCLVEDLYVAEYARGHGVARHLLKAAFVDADARDCYRVYWQTDETNANARRLYDSIASRAPVVKYRLNRAG